MREKIFPPGQTTRISAALIAGQLKPRLLLLFTRDANVDRAVAETLLGREAIILVARSVRDALEIVFAGYSKSILQSWMWMRNSAGSRS